MTTTTADAPAAPAAAIPDADAGAGVIPDAGAQAAGETKPVLAAARARNLKTKLALAGLAGTGFFLVKGIAWLALGYWVASTVSNH